MPRSVQQSIPIDRIYADGVWQSENVFSLMWQISDINYAMQSDAAKQNILTQLGTVYAGIPADCWMQVCIVSQRILNPPQPLQGNGQLPPRTNLHLDSSTRTSE